MMTTELKERARRFMDASPVFTRDEFAAAMDLPKGSAHVGCLLREQVVTQRLKRLRREVYAAVPKCGTRGRLVLPDYFYASKYRPDGVLGYHTGLMLFGVQYTAFVYQVQVISNGRTGYANTPFGRCRFIKPHRALVDAGKTDFLTVLKEAEGVQLRVTAFERTLVDVLHRADRAGGKDEIIDALASAPYILKSFDPELVAEYVELLGICSLVGVVGWWLERWQSELNVSERTLDRLRAMLPHWVSYGLRSRPGRAKLVSRWRVYLPPDALDATFQGIHPDEWERLL